jgi:hypothetical protein
MPKYARSEDFKSPPCRLSFAQSLFKPRSVSGGAEKYGCTLIFEKNVDRRLLDAAVRFCIVETWGEKGLQRAKDGLIKSPFLDGAGKEGRNKETGEFQPGMGPDVFFIRPSATVDYPPIVLYRSPNIPATEEEVYSGCYGFAVLNAFAWNNSQSGDGVSFGIKMFQKKSDGERLGGGGPINPEKWHEKIEDAGEAPPETRNGAGASGLFG